MSRYKIETRENRAGVRRFAGPFLMRMETRDKSPPQGNNTKLISIWYKRKEGCKEMKPWMKR
jgi:hypothetical protein